MIREKAFTECYQLTDTLFRNIILKSFTSIQIYILFPVKSNTIDATQISIEEI